MKLDRNRPYGTISGVLAGCGNARFTQDNIIFDVEGNLANPAQANKAVALLNERAEEAKRVAVKAVADAEAMMKSTAADVKRLRREAAALNGDEVEDEDEDEEGTEDTASVIDPKTVAEYTTALGELEVEIPEGAKLKDLKVLYAQALEE